MCGGGSVEKIVEEAVNVGTNLVTFGQLGVDDGSLSSRAGVVGKHTQPITSAVKNVVGAFGEPIGSALKDITGASATEEATALARARFEEEKNKAIEKRKEGISNTARDQLAASRLASSVRSSTSGSNRSTSSRSSRFSSLGSDERDFLGL